MRGYIYILLETGRPRENGCLRYKFGMSVNPYQRRATLNCGHADQLELIDEVFCENMVECHEEMKRLFSSAHIVNGGGKEWYRLCDSERDVAVFEAHRLGHDGSPPNPQLDMLESAEQLHSVHVRYYPRQDGSLAWSAGCCLYEDPYATVTAEASEAHNYEALEQFIEERISYAKAVLECARVFRAKASVVRDDANFAKAKNLLGEAARQPLSKILDVLELATL